jgi:hypothetical protein
VGRDVVDRVDVEGADRRGVWVPPCGNCTKLCEERASKRLGCGMGDE